MVSSTVVLRGHVIHAGVRFLWWVTDGNPARVTVSHPLHGTRTRVAEQDPASQARGLAKELLGSP